MAADPRSIVEQFLVDIQPAMDVDAMSAQVQAIRDHMESICGLRFVVSRAELETDMRAPIRFNPWQVRTVANPSDVATFLNAQEPSNWDIANTTVATDLGDESNTVAVRLQRILDSNSPLMERARLDALAHFRSPFVARFNADDAAATARSKALLERHLSPSQLEEFRRSESFTVQVRGRGEFQIMKGKVFNVRELATGETWCAGPQGVPVYDFMLAQKMTLETCPEEFFAVANRQGDLLRYFETEWHNRFEAQRRRMGI